jgi:hypothetical protein
MIVSAKKLRDAMACVRGFFFGRNQRLDADGDNTPPTIASAAMPTT